MHRLACNEHVILSVLRNSRAGESGLCKKDVSSLTLKVKLRMQMPPSKHRLLSALFAGQELADFL